MVKKFISFVIIFLLVGKGIGAVGRTIKKTWNNINIEYEKKQEEQRKYSEKMDQEYAARYEIRYRLRNGGGKDKGIPVSTTSEENEEKPIVNIYEGSRLNSQIRSYFENNGHLNEKFKALKANFKTNSIFTSFWISKEYTHFSELPEKERVKLIHEKYGTNVIFYEDSRR